MPIRGNGAGRDWRTSPEDVPLELARLMKRQALNRDLSAREDVSILAMALWYLELRTVPVEECLPGPAHPDDEEVAFEAIRPYARWIAAAVRVRDRRRDEDQIPDSASEWVRALGSACFWLPEFWSFLADLTMAASGDPGRMLESAAPSPPGIKALEPSRHRRALSLRRDFYRGELEKVFLELKGRNRRGATKGTVKVDHLDRKQRVIRKADEIDRRSGGRERAPMAKAVEALAPIIEPGRRLKPSTLKRSLSRAGKR